MLEPPCTPCRKSAASRTAIPLINNWVGSVPLEEWPKVVQLIEVTPTKTVVWALRDWTTLGPASSMQLLDEPGGAEKEELQRCLRRPRLAVPYNKGMRP